MMRTSIFFSAAYLTTIAHAVNLVPKLETLISAAELAKFKANQEAVYNIAEIKRDYDLCLSSGKP